MWDEYLIFHSYTNFSYLHVYTQYIHLPTAILLLCMTQLDDARRSSQVMMSKSEKRTCKIIQVLHIFTWKIRCDSLFFFALCKFFFCLFSSLCLSIFFP